jgi:hypothetical protein
MNNCPRCLKESRSKIDDDLEYCQHHHQEILKDCGCKKPFKELNKEDKNDDANK